MGTYTGLWVKARVKPEYHKPIQWLHTPNWMGWRNSTWDDVYERFPDFPGHDTWRWVDRRNHIPFSDVNFMPPLELPYIKPEFCEENGLWEFSCSLKNYDDEIEKFINLVLDPITQKVEQCCTLGEWWQSNWNAAHENLIIRHLREKHGKIEI
jgi:hypothetical protein